MNNDFRRLVVVLVFVLFSVIAFASVWQPPAFYPIGQDLGAPKLGDGFTFQTSAVIVLPSVETDPSHHAGDTADDLAIWIHPTNPSLSLVIGNDKEGGLMVWGFDGEEVQYVDAGRRYNHVDLRYNFPLTGTFRTGQVHDKVALVGVSDETEKQFDFYKVNPFNRRLEAAGNVNSPITPYGGCMYYSNTTGKYYFIAPARNGQTAQVRLRDGGNGQVVGNVARQFSVGNITEGCVADDLLGHLYMGQEDVGIWKYGAEPDAGDDRTLVDSTNATEGGNLVADVEGLSIYYAGADLGYLFASSQGESRVALYTREGANAFLGKFDVGANGTIDEVTGSDGLDVTNFPLGAAFPSGLFAVHDASNSGANASNVKYVHWGSVADALGLGVHTGWDPRRVGSDPPDTVTVTFQEGDGGTHSETDDTYIHSGTPDTNYGAATKMYVDADGCGATGTVCKVLVKFPDIIGDAADQVPSGVTLVDATLEIAVTNAGGPQDVYQVTEAWGEATATWNGFAPPGSPVTKPRTASFTPPVGRIRVDITSIAQNWANGESNQGILIASTSTNGADYDSSESANPPKLSVTFLAVDQAPPPPPPPFDFSVAVNPASGSVAPGGSASTTVTATLVSGSTHEVQYSVSNLPTDTTGTFSPTACSPTCSVSLSLTTSSNTPEGTHSVRVTATDGSVSRSTTYTLTVGTTFVLSFRKGDGGPYSETDDAFMYNGAPNNNYGRDAVLYVDAAGCIAAGTICRSVLKFPDFIGPNSGQVKPGSTILSASLEVTITNAGGTQTLYQVSEGWTESGVTWNGFAIPGSPATKGNGISFAAPLGVITLNITAIVQNWVNGDPNDGLLITSASTNGADYRSSESIGPPNLTVTFRSSSPPLGGPTESGSDPVPPDGSPATSPTSWNLAFETRTREGI